MTLVAVESETRALQRQIDDLRRELRAELTQLRDELRDETTKRRVLSSRVDSREINSTDAGVYRWAY